MVRAPYQDEFGKTVGVVVVGRDISALEHKEQQLRNERDLLQALMDNIPDLIYFKDMQSRFIRVNRAMAARLHLDDPIQAQGKTDFDYLTREHAEQALADEQGILRTGTALIGKVERAEQIDGSYHWFSTTKVPTRDSAGHIQGLVGISRDITKSKENQDRLNEYSRKLEQSNRELQDFAYVASHDLQEPLRKILAFEDRLQVLMPDMQGQAKDYFNRMQSAALRMRSLIQGLLTLSRVIASKQPPVATDLNRVLNEVLADLEIRIEEAGAQVEAGDLPTLMADPMQMRQLFLNLLGNALKFARPDVAPVLRIVAEIWRDRMPPAAELRFEDNGIGFDPQHSERIFQVFQRLHGRDEYEGTGIGLAICRKIVERHGGTIQAMGRPGQGAVFLVRLPLETNGEVDNGTAAHHNSDGG